MQNYDWSKFTVRIPVRANEAIIYDAWATPAGLEKWFLRKADFLTSSKEARNKKDYIQKDDTYEWRWFGHGDETVERGKVLEANGKDFVKFIFGKAGIVSV